jgi:PIN domain nuclease of toxin-antitoxin system
MKLLLDTCALLWLGADPESLSRRAKEALVASPDELHVSAISALEIAIKFAKGRLVLPVPPENWYPRVLQTYRLHEIPVSGTIALRAPRVALAQSSPTRREP